MAVQMETPPEPAVLPRRRRFLPQFRMRTLFFLVLVVAAFFAGRATQQAYVNWAKAKEEATADLLRRAQDFRENLKPLNLPPGVKNVTWGTKTPGQLCLMTGPSHCDGYFATRFDSFYIDVSAARFSNLHDRSRAARAEKIVNYLKDQIRDQTRGGASLECGASLTPPQHLSAAATLVYPYGSVHITGCYLCVDGAADQTLVDNEMRIEITTHLRVDNTWSW